MYIGFGSEGDFSLSWYDGSSFFASFFTGLGLASCDFLEGVSGELLVSHDLRCSVISRGDGGRQNFNTGEEDNSSAKDRFQGRQAGRAAMSGIDKSLNMGKVASLFRSFGVISKNNTLRHGRPVRLAHLAHITSIANQDATSICRRVLILGHTTSLPNSITQTQGG